MGIAVALNETGLIEELAANAWPALVTQVVDGWRLRFNLGVTRRANSVLPVASGGLVPLRQRIAIVERFYRERREPVRYQISPAAQPSRLDAELARQGYEVEAPTLLQVAGIDAVASAAQGLAAEADPVSETAPAEWFDTYNRAEGLSREVAAIRHEIVGRIGPRAGFALARIGGEPAGVGLGVVERGWLGIFDMATRPQFRRNGAATAVLDALAAWGRNLGAERLYLQVLEENRAARSVYAAVGFQTLYRYHYRVYELEA